MSGNNMIMCKTATFFLLISISCYCLAQKGLNVKFTEQNQFELDSLFNVLKINVGDFHFANREEIGKRYIELRKLKMLSIPERFDDVRDSLYTDGYIQVDSLKSFFEHSIWIEDDPYTVHAFNRLWKIAECKMYIIRMCDATVSYGYEEQLPVHLLLSHVAIKSDFEDVKRCAEKYPDEFGFYVALHVFSQLYSKDVYRVILKEEILSIPGLDSGIVDEIRLHFF